MSPVCLGWKIWCGKNTATIWERPFEWKCKRFYTRHLFHQTIHYVLMEMVRKKIKQRPRLTKEELRAIYDKTNGYCNLCGKKLSFVNYGKLSGRAPWEIDHSNPISKGGTNYSRNLYPVCPSCNRSKGVKRQRAHREKSWLEQILGLWIRAIVTT